MICSQETSAYKLWKLLSYQMQQLNQYIQQSFSFSTGILEVQDTRV